eukprot:365932-Chlamydomonas_euryale.AAC.16
MAGWLCGWTVVWMDGWMGGWCGALHVTLPLLRAQRPHLPHVLGDGQPVGKHVVDHDRLAGRHGVGIDGKHLATEFCEICVRGERHPCEPLGVQWEARAQSRACRQVKGPQQTRCMCNKNPEPLGAQREPTTQSRGGGQAEGRQQSVQQCSAGHTVLVDEANRRWPHRFGRQGW